MVKPSDSQIFVAIEVGINVKMWVGPTAGPDMPTNKPDLNVLQGLSRTMPVGSYAESLPVALVGLDDMIDRIQTFIEAQALNKL